MTQTTIGIQTARNLLFSRRFWFTVALLGLIIGFPLTTITAQSTTQTLTGWLTILYGDPEPGQAGNPVYSIRLQNSGGSVLAELLMDNQLARTLYGQQVRITGVPGAGSSSVGGAAVLEVLSATPLSSDITAQALTGAQPWANILCKFPDAPNDVEPHAPAWYSGLFGTSYPGLDHYFQTISYGNISLTGTTISPQWYQLPRTRSSYMYLNTVYLDMMAQDCVNIAVGQGLDLTGVVGINFMLTQSIGCCAWGGGTVIRVNGVSRFFRATWMPPGSQKYHVLAHEMGHGFGFPHSTGPADNPPSSLQVYVSPYDVMSDAYGYGMYCADFSNYGCIPPGTIAYHLDLDGWIPTDRKRTVAPGELAAVTLQRLLPQSASNLLLARVPIAGTNLFYTVEVRDNTPGTYDQAIYPDSTPPRTPSPAVLIHLVNPSRSFQDGQALIVDSDGNGELSDQGTRWLAGESFTDVQHCISIKVTGTTGAAFTVDISNRSNNPNSCNVPDRNVFTQPFNLTWNRTAGAAKYRIQVANNPQFNTPIVNTVVYALQYTVSGLPAGTYYWRVQALDAADVPGTWATDSFTVLS